MLTENLIDQNYKSLDSYKLPSVLIKLLNLKFNHLNIKNLSMSFFENQMECFSKGQLMARASILIKKEFTNQGQSDISEKLS